MPIADPILGKRYQAPFTKQGLDFAVSGILVALLTFPDGERWAVLEENGSQYGVILEILEPYVGEES